MSPLSTSLTAVAILFASASATDPPTVTVKNGSYYGVHQETYDQDLFLGMPYAQPPVGDLRFRIPQSLNSTWSEARNATEYSPECYGYGSDHGVSEGANLPVGVWIHGGGFYQGGSRDPRYNLSYIVNEAAEAGMPFIGVSFNYRLQAFGFLYGSAVHDAGATNLGFRDQRLALHWVQENIAAFGGDTSKVTIWGESAGGRGVSYQLIAYGGRDDGLFRSAIMQSGSPVKYIPTPYTNASAWDVYYNNITSATNCSSAVDTLDCLRQVPVGILSDILNSSVASAAPWGPVVDGDYIQDTGPALLSAGKFVHVPILLGTNNDEGTAFGKTGVDTSEEFFEYLVWANNNVTSYSYLFNVLTAGVSQYIGSTHFVEVAFVFYNLLGDGYNNSVATNPFLDKPESYKQLARLVTRMWASFIVNQTPNQSGVTTLKWPEYTLDAPQNLVFDANVTETAYIEPDTFRAEAIAHMINNP
eukprot:jgi/Phyca11/577335/estExt2_Genewise1.C_PHYCAscaffold_1080005